MKEQFMVIDENGEGADFFDSLDDAVKFAKKDLTPEFVDYGYQMLIYKVEKLAAIYIPINPEPVIDWIDTTA